MFRHPLTRSVAYESQLRSARGELHRCVAAALVDRHSGSVEDSAALIAEHLEAAGDLSAAYDWHMSAGMWLTNRDISAARTSWQRALQIADRLPEGDPARLSLQIAPRATLCATAFRMGGGAAETGFEELRALCTASGDQRSLAIGMNGLVTIHLFEAGGREASRRADELLALLDAIGDTALTLALSIGVATAKHETAEMADVLRVTQRIIDLADGDPTKGNVFLGSPLALAQALRGAARFCLGIPGWRDDLDRAQETVQPFEVLTRQAVNFYSYMVAIPYGVLVPDVTALRRTAEVLSTAEHSGDDLAVFGAQIARGVALLYHDGPDRNSGFDLVVQTRERCLAGRYSEQMHLVADIHVAHERVRSGDFNGAIDLSRPVVDSKLKSGGSIWTGLATTVLVEALLGRGGGADLDDAQDAIDRLAAVPTDRGFVLHDITLLRLRTLLARARGDGATYRKHRDHYRSRATELGFEGHIAMAEAMP